MKLFAKKKAFLSLGAATLIALPLVATVSCGQEKNGFDLMGGGANQGIDKLSHKLIEEDLTKTNRAVTVKPKKTFGDASWVKKLEAQNFSKFVVDHDFKQYSSGVFQRSPRTMLPNTPGIDNNGFLKFDEKEKDGTLKWDFGISKLVNFVKNNKGDLKLSVVPGSEDDSNGTLIVKAEMDFNGKKVTSEYILDGFSITKDIELNGDNFTSITSIIDALNDKTHLDFEKKVSIMTPQDLKNELIDLYNDTYGGRLTIIGTYKEKVSAIALDRHQMLEDLINAFGNVSYRKRFDGTWIGLGMSLTGQSEVDVPSLIKLFSEYSKDLPTDQDKNDVAGLLGNLPAEVINMFPELLKLFSEVANGVKNMDMVHEWAKSTPDPQNGGTYESKIAELNHILVQWVLKTGKWK